MNEHNASREMDIEVGTHFFGHIIEVTHKLSTISPVRVRKNGHHTYLPQYSDNLRDSFLIVDAIREMGGDFTLGATDMTEWLAHTTIGKASFDGKGASPERAICTLALAISQHPYFKARLQPKIAEPDTQEDSNESLAPAKEESSIKRAWYDAR